MWNRVFNYSRADTDTVRVSYGGEELSSGAFNDWELVT